MVRNRVTDAQFEVIEHRWKPQWGDLAWYAFWVGGWAIQAWVLNNRAASVLFILMAGLAWPVRRWLGYALDRVSPEQSEALRRRIVQPKHGAISYRRSR